MRAAGAAAESAVGLPVGTLAALASKGTWQLLTASVHHTEHAALAASLADVFSLKATTALAVSSLLELKLRDVSGSMDSQHVLDDAPSVVDAIVVAMSSRSGATLGRAAQAGDTGRVALGKHALTAQSADALDIAKVRSLSRALESAGDASSALAVMRGLGDLDVASALSRPLSVGAVERTEAGALLQSAHARLVHIVGWALASAGTPDLHEDSICQLLHAEGTSAHLANLGGYSSFATFKTALSMEVTVNAPRASTSSAACARAAPRAASRTARRRRSRRARFSCSPRRPRPTRAATCRGPAAPTSTRAGAPPGGRLATSLLRFPPKCSMLSLSTAARQTLARAQMARASTTSLRWAAAPGARVRTPRRSRPRLRPCVPSSGSRAARAA